MEEDKSLVVTMRVRIGESEIEVTGPKKFVEDKIVEFLDKMKSGTSANLDEVVPKAGTASLSVAQFFKKHSLKTDVDRVLAAGQYLETYRQSQSFTASEIRDVIKDAKIPPPANSNLCINQNIKKGFMMAAGDKDSIKAYVLTSDGAEYLSSLKSS